MLAKALESCPHCPSAGLDFHSWRTGMETHAFGRAPLPEFKIGAEPVRAVETHDLDDAKINDSQLQQWLRGIPPVATRPLYWMTASVTDATS